MYACCDFILHSTAVVDSVCVCEREREREAVLTHTTVSFPPIMTLAQSLDPAPVRSRVPSPHGPGAVGRPVR